MSYRIKTVASITGISTTTLRAWERRYDLLEPRRTISGYRVYGEQDVAILTRVKGLIDGGLKAGEAVDLIRRELAPPSAATTDLESLARLRNELLESLLAMDQAGADAVYVKLAGIPFDRTVDEVILPLLVKVGDLWEGGACSIAQEHFSSAYARQKLLGLTESLRGGRVDGPEAVCAGIPGELHELGLMAAGIHLAIRGWKVTYLGAELPIDELQGVLARRMPALVCTSVVRRRSRSDSVRLAAAFRAIAPRDTAVVIGGAGVPQGMPSSADDRLFFVREISDLFALPLAAGN